MAAEVIDIKLLADTQARSAAERIGHTDADWQTLSAVKAHTIPWSVELGRCYGAALYGDQPAQEGAGDRGDQEQAFAVWYERLVSGVPGESFWAETALQGFSHASADVDNGRVLAALGRVADLFLAKAAAAFPDRAIPVFAAFRKTLDVAAAVMVDSYVFALVRGMSQIGLNDRLLKRMRTVAIRKMIDDGRESIPLMTWDDALSVGVEEIDNQHKKLIAILNELHHAKAAGKGDATLKSVLRELVDYTHTHFAYEESLFATHGYPQEAEHVKAHVALKAQVVAFGEAFESGKASLSADLFMFLRNWLNGHIRGNDRRYTPFFRDKGVS